MAKPDFEATWYPRIGKEAAEELRRGRKIVTFGITAPLFAVAAGLLIGTGTLNDVIGVVLAVVVVGYLLMFINAQRRIAAAMSDWFGVKIKGLPKMNPKRFDAWCEERGLHHKDEQFANDQAAQSSGPVQRG
jgi:choline-glycine betaine transporter